MRTRKNWCKRRKGGGRRKSEDKKRAQRRTDEMDKEGKTWKKLNEKRKKRILKKNSPPNMYNVHCRKKAVTENRTGF